MSEQRTRTPPLTHVRVRDCMHPGILTCATDDSLRHVAAVMAQRRVHAVVMTSRAGERPVGILSDLDVVAAVAADTKCTASEAADTQTVTVSADAPLLSAARMMNQHGVSHLVVVEGASGYPVGVLSSLDIAAVYAER
jgi:crotonyl-CoA carboxylase/reductase